ncbi:MAG: flagellar motor protein MotA [Alphaproteobacteria bacterium]|nr:flagellar motor protein MotA [Alphaproteobacteria bacterium]
MARAQASKSVANEYLRQITKPRSRFDLATILGLIAGFGLIVAAMYFGGSATAFIETPAILIVVGGTFGVTTICFSLGEMGRLPKIAFKALFHAVPDAGKTALHMLRLAELSRKRGILGLDQILEDFNDEPFMHKAVTMAVDGIPVEEIHAVLQREINQTADRHARSANILRKAAEIAPAMGLIGTLIGLVQMLGNLDDPASIGPGLAVALLTTFYGAVLANMVFAPMATKLERNTAEEMLVANVCMLAAESVCRKENPRRLEMLLNAMLPPAKRIQYFN